MRVQASNRSYPKGEFLLICPELVNIVQRGLVDGIYSSHRSLQPARLDGDALDASGGLMTSKQNQIYFVHLFVVSRCDTVGIAAESTEAAAKLARGWYRHHCDELDSGDFILGDEVSHYLVRADDQPEESAELFEAAENPLISILVDLVDWHDQAPHAKDIAQLVADARERVRHRV
jgi:hypothetical protein